jgi:hypothetical protein
MNCKIRIKCNDHNVTLSKATLVYHLETRTKWKKNNASSQKLYLFLLTSTSFLPLYIGIWVYCALKREAKKKNTQIYCIACCVGETSSWCCRESFFIWVLIAVFPLGCGRVAQFREVDFMKLYFLHLQSFFFFFFVLKIIMLLLPGRRRRHCCCLLFETIVLLLVRIFSILLSIVKCIFIRCTVMIIMYMNVQGDSPIVCHPLRRELCALWGLQQLSVSNWY